ncbi:uncharacterized protein LOC115997962 [Ipomoea triloba]|uniref:uncharacterized protein LOC115997962 n=1 Tax=Ipomoea triloba TaxID=35885 RepID=UPI00125DFEC9|nr:uncharacterized protein LOC115997962 [Ipomoea triloba]XP_031093246.1 uncharacterized protein LOC115997962 [Ipomoea triloba]
MKLKIVSPFLQCPYVVTPQISGSLVPTSFSSKNHSEMDYKIVCGPVSLHPVRARNFLRLRFQRGDAIKRICCVNVNGVFGEEGFEFRDRLAEKIELAEDKGDYCCAIYEKSLGLSSRKKDSKFPSHFDPLEPAMLGINPDPPNWPERQLIMWENVEQKAKSFGLPLSLRMIKKKLQWEVGVRDLGESACCSVKRAFSSMVSIIVQLQTYVLQMREVLCDEDLEVIVAKVQREMCASYVWLFQKVFSRTPALMIYLMILLANFSVHSASLNIPVADATLLGSVRACEIAEAEAVSRLNKNLDVVPEESSAFADQELRNETDIQLWNSIVDEVTKMRGLEEAGLDREVMQSFVSPLSVHVEPDFLVDYFKMDFLYQMMLSQDPYNTLLLCNYAQFLHLVAQDYDRAEECFKRGMEVEPPDGEVLSQYATFLWTVRKDLSEAEEMYRQATDVEPGNPYYAAQYSNFLWSNGGGEESCSRTNSSYDNIKTLNS